MKYSGKIDNINHVVVTDPMYKQDVCCRYEKNNINGKDWIVELEIYSAEVTDSNQNIYEKGIAFYLIMKRNERVCQFDGEENIKYLKNIEIKNYSIGMDSACIAFGMNDKAKQIVLSSNSWQPPCAIRTGTDGIFGDVYEGIEGEKVSFLIITGFFDDELINKNDLFDYLVNQFEIKELIREDYELVGDSRVLQKGDKVELSACFITNDVGGTPRIRNSKFKDESDGVNLTIEHPDGHIEHTIIESSDKLVQLPIEVEVLDNYYDYETGYRYKGKLINKDLKEKFNEIGITGFKPEDYIKKHATKEAYETAKEASKNYNPEIIYFSEFDVVKVLERVEDKDMGAEL